MRPPITQRCLKTISLYLQTNIRKDRALLRRPRSTMLNDRNKVQICEIEKDNLKDSQGEQIRTENMESFKYKILKQKQLRLQWFRKLPEVSDLQT